MWKQVREIMELEYSGADAATVMSSKLTRTRRVSPPLETVEQSTEDTK